LLFSSRGRDDSVAFDVVSETAAENAMRLDDARARAIRATGARYVRLTVGHMPKALRWLRNSLKKDLGRRTDAFLPPSLLGRVNRDDLDWASVPPPVREVRLQFWLEATRESVPERFFPTLAQCETTAEMRFLVSILQQNPWQIVERGHLRHGRVDLHVHRTFGDGHFDFVIEHRTSKLFPPVAVEIVRASLSGKGSAHLLEIQAAADASHYLFDAVRSADAAARGAWWARLIKDAAADDRFQAREVDPRRLRTTQPSA
jgi:hypothetical protein